MKLRELKTEDADRMLEWMHDPYVVDKMQTDFAQKTLNDCLSFINNSKDECNMHLAIVNDDDLYMGTVSLKNITDHAAEFAITVHQDAMGQGYSIWALKEILKIAFEKYRLSSVYWCVAKDNMRALRFYDKNNFHRVDSGKISGIQGYTKDQIDSYVWYQVK